LPGTNTQMYSYTSAGQITGKSLQVGLIVSPADHYDSTVYTLALNGGFGYDNEGHMTTMTYPQTYTLNPYFQQTANPTQQYNYSYDGMGRPYTMGSGSSQNNLVSATQYGPSDERTQLTNGSGVVFETRTYNSLVQLTSINNTVFQYFYSATQNNGRITGASHLAGGETEGINYYYDSLNRLISANGSGLGTTIPAWTEAYTYDGFGNLLDKTSTGGAPTLQQAVYANTNQIVGQGYDANGNATNYGSYDYENRLAGSGGHLTHYTTATSRRGAGHHSGGRG